MTNLVMGTIQNYTFEDIKPWLYSLKKTGYTGEIAVLAFSPTSEETLKALEEENVSVFYINRKPEHHICTERFLIYHRILMNFYNSLDNVLLTDVKDVIFQQDPFLISFAGTKLTLSGEGISYRNEPWGQENLISFSEESYVCFQFEEILNCGVIYLHGIGFARMFTLMLYNLALSAGRGEASRHPGGGGYDQAALNVLARTFTDGVQVLPHYMVAQCGTMKDPRKIGAFKEHWRDGVMEPYMRDDGIIEFSPNVTPMIVHQYDRVPGWADIIKEKYK